MRAYLCLIISYCFSFVTVSNNRVAYICVLNYNSRYLHHRKQLSLDTNVNTMNNPISHNGFSFLVVRQYADKSVIEITPTTSTPTNLSEYPLFVTDVIDTNLTEWVKDNY